MVYKEATSTGFWRLFKFIGGENEQGADLIFVSFYTKYVLRHISEAWDRKKIVKMAVSMFFVLMF